LISNAARFYARLKAMEGNGEARVLATPTVLTLNNVAAVLDLSQTKYMPLVGERVADLADITAGTMLRVIPRIVQDGADVRVRLEVDIEDGNLGDGSANGNVTRSTISTQAIIDLQQTLMIGGYRAESLSNKKQKVPLLGDVPLFGNLFSTRSSSESHRERLFLITPRLIGSSGQAAAPARAKRPVPLPPEVPVPRPAQPAPVQPAPQAAPAAARPAPAQPAPAQPAPAAAPASSPAPAFKKLDPPTLFAAPAKSATSRCKRPKAALSLYLAN
jgi:type III secretion protein C